MTHLSFYLFFHLNIFFSSIEEDDRPKVVEKCYWPLLHLIEQNNVNINIEASALTLEIINHIDPSWTKKLKSLLSASRCTFIGSGYSQIIGPLVPAVINIQNLRIGNKIYEEILGITPSIGLINEQAWSKGLVDIYLDAGYETLIMEWDNPARSHPEWDRLWQYFPQYGLGTDNRKIKLIWNHSISFQKLQRYIHGELSWPEYLQYLAHLQHPSGGFFSIYGNDAEVFNFRPGRFHTECQHQESNEWEMLYHLILKIGEIGCYRFVTLDDLLSCENNKLAWQSLDLTSVEQPIPVKKQPKYNICRWAVTGRDDTGINTTCHKILNHLKSLPATNNQTDDWKALCYLWSSDFRTHITEPRFKALQQQLSDRESPTAHLQESFPLSNHTKINSDWVSIQNDKRLIHCTTASLKITLDTWKGLAIKGLTFFRLSNAPVVGTLPHGYFDDIAYGADFFTGHLVYTTPGSPQLTDLQRVSHDIGRHDDRIEILCHLQLPACQIFKKVIIKRYDESIEISYAVTLSKKPHGSIRLGYTTFNPELFQRDSLYFTTHNGGIHRELFRFGSTRIDHFKPVSPIVSCSQCLGETEGIIEIGDINSAIRITTDKTRSFSVGGIHFVPIGNTYLLRHIFSILETDDTNNHLYASNMEVGATIDFSFAITAIR